MATMKSLVWGNVSYNILTSHLEIATWDPSGLAVCSMYAYIRNMGESGCKHPGVDITMPHGTPIYAVRAGRVKVIRNPGVSGSIGVRIGDALGHEHEYVHFSSSVVTVGQDVTAGQLIGYSGTMNSPHLHFEHRVPRFDTPSGWGFVDPGPILTQVAPTVPAPTPSGGLNLNAIHSDFRLIGDTTLAVFQAELKRVNSPFLADATAMYNAAKPMSALFLAQAWLENKYGTTGYIIKPEDNNPVAMRPWESDPRRSVDRPIIDWQSRAQVGTMRLPSHYAGATRDSTGMYFARFNTLADAAAEYKHRLQANSSYKSGVYNKARTLGQMLAIWAPAGDIHPVTGVDNASIGYSGTVTTMLQKYAGMQGVPSASPSSGTGMGAHRFILYMGHRNHGRGGATNEYGWTPGATRALRDAIKARGGQVWIVQEEDGDSDPNYTSLDLTASAKVAVDLKAKYGPFKAYLSMHYNSGASPGAFAIYPDGRNRGNDTKAGNPVSVELARKIAAKIKATNTVSLISWTADGPGRMSERETGVGAQGHNLGEMSGTSGLGRDVARLILEAGSYDVARERAYITNPQWVRYTYCEAIVDALEEQFGQFRTVPPAFVPSQTVTLKRGLTLMSAPGSNPTDTHAAGARATIIAGPRFVNGDPWWDIRMATGGTGFVPEDALAGTASSTVDLVGNLTDVLAESITYPQIYCSVWNGEWKPQIRGFVASDQYPGVTIGTGAGTPIRSKKKGTVAEIVAGQDSGTTDVSIDHVYGRLWYRGLQSVQSGLVAGTPIARNQQIGLSSESMIFQYTYLSNGTWVTIDPDHDLRIAKRFVAGNIWGGISRSTFNSWDDDAIWDTTPNCQYYSSNQLYGMVGCKHGGMDVEMNEGDPVYAFRNGTITHMVQASPGAEGYFRLVTDQGHRVSVNHLKNVIALGSTVTAGQKIAEVGPHGPDNETTHIHVDYMIPDTSLSSGWRIVDPVPRLTTAVYVPPRVAIRTALDETGEPVDDDTPKALLHFPFNGSLAGNGQQGIVPSDPVGPVQWVAGRSDKTEAIQLDESTWLRIAAPYASPDSGAVFIRYRLDAPNTGRNAYIWSLGGFVDNGKQFLCLLIDADGDIRIRDHGSGARLVGGSPQVGVWYTAYVAWDTANYYVDFGLGGGYQAVARPAYGGAWSDTSPNNVHLLGMVATTGTLQFNGSIDEYLMVDRNVPGAMRVELLTAENWALDSVVVPEPQFPDQPLPGDGLLAPETDPYTPTAPPEILLASEPLMREGRQYLSTVALYRGTIRGEIVEPLLLDFDGTMTITHNDDAPIKRTIDVTVNDVYDLRHDRRLMPYADTLIPIMTITDDAGLTQQEQLGVYVLAPYGGTDTPTHTITALHGNDLTWLLARMPIMGGWMAPGDTDIGTIVSAKLRELGFTPSQISVGTTGTKTPLIGVPFLPGTTWLQAINTLLAIADWYNLWMNRKGVLVSRPYMSSITSVSPVIHYDTRRGHWFDEAVDHRPDYGRFGNIAIARRLPASPDEPMISWVASNDNPASPVSTVNLGPIMISPIIEGPHITSVATARAAAEAALARGQSFYHPITITTGVELTADANEVIAVDVERAGNPLVTGRWTRRSWELTFDGAMATTRHDVNHVEVF